MKQRKLSSQKARLLQRLQEAELDFEQQLQAQEDDWKAIPEDTRRAMLLYDLQSADHNPTAFVIVTAHEELIAERRRPVLMVALANMRDDGIAHFKKSLSKRFFEVTDADLVRLRQELLTIWKEETLQLRSAHAHEWMSRWLRWEPRQDDELWKSRWKRLRGDDAKQYSPLFPSLEFKSILLDTRNLHAQITQAVLERFENMRICGNPDCAVPYFLARRSDQKFCERGPCTDYGHRHSAREYWRRTHKSTQEPAKESAKKGQNHGRSDSRKTKR